MIRVSKAAAAIRPTLIRQVTDKARSTSINLGLGQPDLPVSDAALVAVQAHLADARAPYTPNLGLWDARQAVANRYDTSAEEVMLTCGVQEGLAVAILGCVNSGDAVLVPNPGFPAYDNLVRLAGATPVPYNLDPADWQPDLESICAQLPNASAMIINTPSNPTGATWSKESTAQIIRMCNQHGVTWISDEIYEDLIYDSDVHHSAQEFSSQGIILSGLSKSHAAMGWRIGWLRAPAPTIQALKPLHQHLVTSAPVFAQHALIGALAEHQARTQSNVRVFQERRDVICASLDAIPGTSYVRPQGAFYVFLNVEAHVRSSSLDLALEILDRCDVVTIPGEGFGTAGANHLRLAFTRPNDEIQTAIERIAEFLGRSSEI